MNKPLPGMAAATVGLAALHALGLAVLPRRAASLWSEIVQLVVVVLAAYICVEAGRRLRGSEAGRFWLLLGLGFVCWSVGQLLILRYIHVVHIPIPAISAADVPFLAFYLPVFAALFPEASRRSRLDWARTLDLAQVGIVLSTVYLHFFFGLNVGVEQRVITLHFGILDSYSLMNLLLVGSYVYAWSASRGQARALYGRMALVFTVYSAGDTLNTFALIAGRTYSGDWLDLSYSVPFALAAWSAARWPARAEAEERSAESWAPEWRLFPFLPPVLVLIVAGSVARRDLTLATIVIFFSFLCFGGRLAVTQWRQRQAIERLGRSEAEYRSLVEDAPYGIFRYDPGEDRFLSVNQALVDMLGGTNREAVLALRPTQDVFREENGRERLLADAAAAGPSSGLEMEWKQRDGTPLTVRLRARPSKDAHAPEAALEVSAEDITEHRELEDRLRQAVKMEAVGRLAGGVAHDFNNLLMVVTGAAELLRRGLGNDPPKLGQVRMIQKAAADAADLTRQLLAFSRRQTLEPRVLDLNQVLADMAEMLSRVIEESIEQRIVLDPGLGRVRADPGQMRQVVLNLAVNARDAMPQGGTLTLETGNVLVDEGFARAYPGLRPGAYVRLIVRDTGGGMDGETSARIFEPFFTTKEKGKGTGLGLATVYGIVKQSGGHIRVESELGRGSTFTVLLPRFDGPSEPARSPRAASPPRAPEGGRAGTILLVEDSAEVRATLGEYLASEGFALVEANCAEDARELVRRGDTAIDVVVADVVLPGKSGIHLSQDLASLRPGLPVILMSGYAEGTVEALPAPGPLLLKKPFPLETLIAAVRERLGSPQPDRSEPPPRPPE